MELALPVVHPHNHVVLLRTGVALDSHSISRLRELDLPHIWVRYPGLESLVRYISPPVLEAYSELAHNLGVALDAAMEDQHARLDLTLIKAPIINVLARLGENPGAALMIGDVASSDRPYVRHCGNVALLSILMGLKLEFYLLHERRRLIPHQAKDITNLAVGAMLHDIGLTRFTSEISKRLNAILLATPNHAPINTDPKKPSLEYDDVYRSHARLGYEMVRDHVDPVAAAIVLNHHQHFDGTGWPQPRMVRMTPRPAVGSNIHVFARIVAAADLYDRLRHPLHLPNSEVGEGEGGLQSMPAVRALRLMQSEPYRSWIDPVVLQALLAIAPPYPPGSLVVLNDGRQAVVVDLNRDEPCRPVVEILGSIEPEHYHHHETKPAQRINLRSTPSLSIASIDGQSVLDDNFGPHATNPSEFDLAATSKALINAAASLPRPLPNQPDENLLLPDEHLQADLHQNHPRHQQPQTQQPPRQPPPEPGKDQRAA